MTRLVACVLTGAYFLVTLGLLGLALMPWPSPHALPTPPASAAPALPPCLEHVPAEEAYPAPLGPPLAARRVDFIVLHHWGGTAPFTPAAALASFTSRGYTTYAYNALVTMTGETWPGRPESMTSAATYGLNDRSIALCLLDDLTRREPSDAALTATGRWLAGAVKRWPRARFIQHADAARIVGRPDYATACPGEAARAHRAAAVIWQLACGFKLPEARRRAAAAS